jgi:hypothetical protein
MKELSRRFGLFEFFSTISYNSTLDNVYQLTGLGLGLVLFVFHSTPSNTNMHKFHLRPKYEGLAVNQPTYVFFLNCESNVASGSL